MNNFIKIGGLFWLIFSLVTIFLTNRHFLSIIYLQNCDRLPIVTNVDAINKEFLEVLLRSFSACEWYGLICRCFGPHYAEFPMLVAQEDYINAKANWAYEQPLNRFFFTELLRLRPQHRDCIHQRMDELKLTVRRRREAETLSLALWASPNRFVEEQGQLIDSLSGTPHHHFSKDVGHLELVDVQQVYEDLLLISQLPIHTFQKVTAIDWIDGTIHVYSTDIGTPIEMSVLALNDHSGLILVAEALDAAHQRDVFHGPILIEHIRQNEAGEIVLGGFGEAGLDGKSLTLADDHQAMADLIEIIFPYSLNLETMCTQLREAAWHGSMREMVHEVIESFIDSDVIPLEDRPAKLEVLSSERISVQVGFQNSVHNIHLRKKGNGPLVLQSNDLPSWLVLAPSKIDPNVQEQNLALTVYTKALQDGLNRFTWTVEDQNGHEIAIHIEAKRSRWLLPALVLFVCLAITGLLVLGRMAS